MVFLLALFLVLPGEDQAFVEIVIPKSSYFLGEEIPVHLRFGIHLSFLRNHVIQSLRREIPVPVRLEAPWFGELEPRHGGTDFVLNGKLARIQSDGEPGPEGFSVFRIGKSFRPEQPGTWTLEGARLHFSFAEEFREDLLKGRVPVRVEEATVTASPVSVEILPLPTEGRPEGFTGAIGDFSLESSAHPRNLEKGQSLEVTLRIKGTGNLQDFPPPPASVFPGFHSLGRIESWEKEARVFTYELRPMKEGIHEVPVIELAIFDPSPPGAYRLLRTPAIPLQIGAVPAANKARETSPGVSPYLLGTAFLFLAALVLFFLLRRQGKEAPGEPPPFAWNADQPLESLVAVLAGRLSCPPPAVISPDLEQRLLAAGLSADLAARTVSLIEALTAARYGGGSPTPPPRTIEEVARQIHSHRA